MDSQDLHLILWFAIAEFCYVPYFTTVAAGIRVWEIDVGRHLVRTVDDVSGKITAGG